MNIFFCTYFLGIAVGNGFTDPETMLSYGEYMYQLGLIDLKAKAEIQKLEIQGKKAIREKHFIDAFYVSIFFIFSTLSIVYTVGTDYSMHFVSINFC